MSMYTVIAKNSSGSAQLIEDLGISIPNGSQETLSDQYTFDELAGSDDLRALVNGGDLVINDGSADLSAANGELYLTFTGRKYLADTHWTKTQLAATGGAADRIDWSQVQNAPTIGAPEWADPVKYRVTAIASAPPGSPVAGDVYIDTDDDHYHKYNGATWDDLGAASADDAVINLANPNEDVYIFTGGTWTEQSQSANQEARLVQDDGDGKQAQYIYSTTTNAWTKIGDVDFGDHLEDGPAKHNDDQIQVELAYSNIGSSVNDGLDDVLADIDTQVGANATAASNAQSDADAAQSDIDDHVDGTSSKHDASEIDVENAYTNIGNDADDDLETVLNDIDTALGAVSSAGNTLDEAYDQGGAGLGRTITVDSNAVKLDGSGGTNAPLELVPQSAPTTDLQDGQLAMIGDELYAYDDTRGLWLSVMRHTFVFGRRGNTKNKYLNFFGGALASNNTGIRLPWNCTIVAMSAQLDASGTATFTVRESTATRTVNQVVTAALGSHSVAINTDLNAGDLLECYLAATANVQDPMILVEIAKRK